VNRGVLTMGRTNVFNTVQDFVAYFSALPIISGESGRTSPPPTVVSDSVQVSSRSSQASTLAKSRSIRTTSLYVCLSTLSAWSHHFSCASSHPFAHRRQASTLLIFRSGCWQCWDLLTAICRYCRRKGIW
jgi:hypothetical protein